MFYESSFFEAHFIPLSVKIIIPVRFEGFKAFPYWFSAVKIWDRVIHFSDKCVTKRVINRINIILGLSTKFYSIYQTNKAAREIFVSIKLCGNLFSLYLRSMNDFFVCLGRSSHSSEVKLL